ncbi:MAG: bifunctional precorrin-2 dehydrogenase/sirohydrochlorin ferrochelatase [Candidatus Omnitrophota bacterium]
MDYLPIAVKLKDKRVVVVGGGQVALRKIKTLLDAGARVHVISPASAPGVRRLATDGAITWARRHVRRTDIRNASLVIAATNDPVVNEHISQWAREHDVSVNVVDHPAISDFISPAVIRLKKALIAVYTDGRDPVLSRDIKNFLKERWDDFLSYRNRS